MNKICKQYISEVKTFFPIIGKDERDYISKLKTNVDDFCDEVDIYTKDDLYKQYGLPNDIVNDYYSTIETEKIIKRIRLSKHIKRSIVVLLVLAVITTSFYYISLYKAYDVFANEKIVTHNEEVIISY